jgi:hypothetical protein
MSPMGKSISETACQDRNSHPAIFIPNTDRPPCPRIPSARTSRRISMTQKPRNTRKRLKTFKTSSNSNRNTPMTCIRLQKRPRRRLRPLELKRQHYKRK